MSQVGASAAAGMLSGCALSLSGCAATPEQIRTYYERTPQVDYLDFGHPLKIWADED